MHIDPPRHLERLTPTLGAIAAALVLVLISMGLGIGWGVHWQDDAPPPKLPRVGATLPPLVVPPLGQYSAVWMHPLFSPTRTPPVASAHGESLGDLQLTGVILLPGLKMAIVHDKEHDKNYRLTAGHTLKRGPALLNLKPRSAIVETSGARTKLELLAGPSPNPGKVPAGDAAHAHSASRPDVTHNRGAGNSAKVSRRKTGPPQNG